MEYIEYHPIGEVFEYQGRKIKVEKDGCCNMCVFRECDCENITTCSCSEREDGTSVVYVSAEPIKNKDMKKEEHSYTVKKEDLIGNIDGFPIEIVQKMVDGQAKQGNKPDVTVFQKDKISESCEGGFTWKKTNEGNDFWKDVIYLSKFGVFFDKYPEGKEKYNFDENGCIIKEDKNVSTDSNKNETDKDYNVETIWDGFTLKDMKVPKGTFSTIPKNEQEFHNILVKMFETHKKKNNDYGSSFDKSMDEFGMVAPVIRMSDKMNRLKSLIKNKQQVNDESIDDTLLDLANYAVMTLVYRKINLNK